MIYTGSKSQTFFYNDQKLSVKGDEIFIRRVDSQLKYVG